MDKTQGLTCPECSGVVPVKEGDRIVTCPFCGLPSLIQGDHGVRRWQVPRQVERASAIEALKRFFSDIKKARDLPKTAEISDMFLVYLPYWRVQADVAGWLFGRERKDKDSTRPVEVEIMQTMHWADAALDVSEYGVHRVTLSKEMLRPFDSQALHAEAIVFEPTESHTDARQEAHTYFQHLGRRKKRLASTFFEKFHFFHEHLSIVYYPLWIARYAYRQRHYQAVVDGVTGEVLYGKAPGNIFYRAAALVGGMAAGNFILVNGTLIAAQILAGSSDDDGAWLILMPIALGLGLIYAGYRAFRFGEEVEQVDGKVKKAMGGKNQARNLLDTFTRGDDLDWNSVMKTGLDFLEEMNVSGKR